MSIRVTPAEAKAMVIKAAKKPAKYRNEKVTIGGLKFDSKKEGARWGALCVLERAGKISDLRRQVRIPLLGRDGLIRSEKGRVLVYVADFVYRLPDGSEVVEDAKGFRTKEYILKRAVLAAQGVNIREV